MPGGMAEDFERACLVLSYNPLSSLSTPLQDTTLPFSPPDKGKPEFLDRGFFLTRMPTGHSFLRYRFRPLCFFFAGLCVRLCLG